MTAMDEIIISLNGLTPDVYDFHQKGGDFEKVRRGVYLLSSAIEESKTSLILQTVVNQRNLHQLEQLDYFAREHGFDEVVLKSFNVMDNKNDTFSAFVPIGTRFSRYKEDGSTFPMEKSGGPCFEWMVIYWDGDVNPCCWDYEGRYILGNVGDKGVYGVWNSPEMVKHAERISKNDYLDICVDCRNSKIIKRWKID